MAKYLNSLSKYDHDSTLLWHVTKLWI